MTDTDNLKRAAKQELKLIAAEENAARRLLDAQTIHAGTLKKLAKAEKRAHAAAASLAEAESDLAAAQSARAAGPERHEKPPGD
jgi:hypothetical protein